MYRKIPLLLILGCCWITGCQEERYTVPAPRNPYLPAAFQSVPMDELPVLPPGWATADLSDSLLLLYARTAPTSDAVAYRDTLLYQVQSTRSDSCRYLISLRAPAERNSNEPTLHLHTVSPTNNNDSETLSSDLGNGARRRITRSAYQGSYFITTTKYVDYQPPQNKDTLRMTMVDTFRLTELCRTIGQKYIPRRFRER